MSTMPFLCRYSKERGPGDQTSGGLGKLLQSGLSRTELLVRETIQNSWDAKDEGWTPAYGIGIRRVEDDLRELLRESVFTDRAGLGPLERSLGAPGLHVTEVYDRGTRGLDGPIVAGQVASPGSSNNFNALVFDIGTTKGRSGSGGTYGFGKTAAFEASACHAVIYWTCTYNEEGEAEHRLIASCLSEPYAEGDRRFTGAHWWGIEDPRDSVLPLIGEEARELGEKLFEVPFGVADDGSHETGTSMLIIDPTAVLMRSGETLQRQEHPIRTSLDAGRYAERITDDIEKNLWPKMLRAIGAEDPPMLVTVRCEGEEREIAARSNSEYADFGYSLQRVRAAQGQSEEPPENPRSIDAKLYPIRLSLSAAEKKGFSRESLVGERNDGVVGHLHLWVSPTAGSIGGAQPSNRVCIMRSGAELVVDYILGEQGDDEALVRWHGVFKPTPDCDHHFASCEPTSHDSWAPLTTAPAESAYLVRLVMSQIRSKVRGFLNERHRTRAEESRSVRRIANDLRAFGPLGEPDEGRPGRASRASGGGGRRGGRRDHVEITEIGAPLSLPGGTVSQTVVFRISSKSPSAVRITPRIRAITFEGGLELSTDEVKFVFTEGEGVYEPGQTGSLRIFTANAMRLRIDLEEELA